MNPLQLFFAKIRQKFFEWRYNREIYHRIFPHIRDEVNHGYPFANHDDLISKSIRKHLELAQSLHLLRGAVAQMPTAYSDAFRYAAYRDLNDRLEMYLLLAEKQMQPKTCDPRYVATKA